MPRPRKANNFGTPVESLVHRKDRRTNIPTEELRDFVAEDEKAPKVMLYPRDPSLDPQLVWKGKDEQDRADLAIPVIPVYIQEKIHPQALIEDIRAHAKAKGGRIAEEAAAYQISLFGEFNGLTEFDQKVEFYQHDQHWSNRMILGDSLLVMTSLAEKEGLKGKVQCIYMDPPYGIKFGSNWQVSTRKRDVRDGRAEDATRQPEQVRAFRDTWELHIHSYLAYLRDRLVVAQELLTETGSIFVQIGDENVHLVRCIMDEVFGGENFISMIYFRKTGGHSDEALGSAIDNLLWYAKNRLEVKIRQLLSTEELPDPDDPNYVHIQSEDGYARRMTVEERRRVVALPDGVRVFRYGPITGQGVQPKDRPIAFEGEQFTPEAGRHWSTSPEGIERAIRAARVGSTGEFLGYTLFWDEIPKRLGNVWQDTQSGGFLEDRIYVVQTTPKVIGRCLLMTTDPGDLVLDPTCGSGTTAYVAEHWGRRWITIDTSRVALALARTRLMSARYPYYLLADSQEGVKKEAEVTGRVPPSYPTENDVRKGFVYKRVPHVTLKSIANNEEIDTIHAKWQEELEPLRADLNKLVGARRAVPFQEWEIPREADSKWPEPAKKAHAEWWRMRLERQKEIDASIAKRADTELLYDQPYEDNKRIRVTGPFTVESLSPHRVLSTADENMDGKVSPQEVKQQQDFATMILDNLKKAGVQNTKKKERLTFETLEPYAGAWLHAKGTYKEADGKSKRVAISIGPEHGTVGPQQIKEAAKEAVQGIGVDLLIVCGFAFDPHVTEEVKRYGKLTVLPARMNPDLAMGDELLKKTGAGNLFMVFGEPDVEVRTQKDGQIAVEIKGLDIYDPTTGDIRSSSTDDIACWFIDTDYNGESFFVRHAYFCGDDEPYEKLKRALKAEVDEAAWASICGTTSRPFPKPASGKFAIKVINHYGDEVLKVYDLKTGG